MRPHVVFNANTPIPGKVALYLVRVEKYALPLLYAFLALRQVRILREHMANAFLFKALHPDASVLNNFFAVGSVRHILLLVLVSFCGVTLLFSRAPTALPSRFKDVFPPLAMSFYFVLYTMVDYLPSAWRQNLLPPQWQFGFSVLGVLLSIVGYTIAFWAISYLRRAFGLFVSVRDVILGGPYAYVRHPIYAGYFLDSLGLLAVTCSIAMFVLFVGFISLMIYRAKIEEEKLSGASEQYALYRQKTGFLFPRSFPERVRPAFPPVPLHPGPRPAGRGPITRRR